METDLFGAALPTPEGRQMPVKAKEQPARAIPAEALPLVMCNRPFSMVKQGNVTTLWHL